MKENQYKYTWTHQLSFFSIMFNHGKADSSNIFSNFPASISNIQNQVGVRVLQQKGILLVPSHESILHINIC